MPLALFTKVDKLHEDITAGTLISSSPTDVALLFDGTTKAFSGAVFNLFASDDGGTKITFVPINTSDLSLPDDIQQQLENSGIFFGAAATNSENPNSSIVVYGHTLAGDPRQFDTTSAETVNSGQATLIGVSGNGQVFCETCDFMKWGAWLTAVNVADHPDAEHAAVKPNRPFHTDQRDWLVGCRLTACPRSSSYPRSARRVTMDTRSARSCITEITNWPGATCIWIGTSNSAPACSTSRILACREVRTCRFSTRRVEWTHLGLRRISPTDSRAPAGHSW